ncbi:hydrogenase formation protein HypD [Bacillus tianshenii]|nr:hydrogenase formation protein HypD [Bacillus tianshenii]
MREMLEAASDPQLSKKLLQEVKHLCTAYKRKHHRLPVLMEVCGSHTMALAKTGVKQALKDDLMLISGPGCPVCVTAQEEIDAMIQLAEDKRLIVCTFGDMMRVPGSTGTLMDAKAEGSDIRIVYSPLDAVQIAAENLDKAVVFLGVGFETTIPILAAAVASAKQQAIDNFSVWVTTKLVEPVLRTLLDNGEVKIDAFLLPGHVAIVTGSGHFEFLSQEYNIAGAITGFEPVELLSGLYQCLALLLNEEARIENSYKAVVTYEGNKAAQQLMETYFQRSDENWRGLGVLPNSGLSLREEYALHDAKKKFKIKPSVPRKTKCRCGEVISGKITPEECVLFGKACTPLQPIGPCMVSSEGSCSASYQFLREVSV